MQWYIARAFCSALAALVGLVQNIFSSSYTISIPVSPSPRKLGKQPCWVACLLVCVFGNEEQIEKVSKGKRENMRGKRDRGKGDKGRRELASECQRKRWREEC